MSAYGDGHFGYWITDEVGLPAYEYTCDHRTDPSAAYRTGRRLICDHYHLLGNQRAKALAHNEGYIELFRPEPMACWLNRYAPQRQAYGGGFGFLRCEGEVRSTLYQHLGSAHYRRILGVGYFRKSAVWGELAIEQVAFLPFGDDPVLLNLTTLSNRGAHALTVTYVEYWDVLVAPVLPGRGEAWRILEGLRHRRCTTFDEKRRLLLCSPAKPHRAARVTDPPVIFLAAIDSLPVTGYETSRAAFFGAGGLSCPDALEQPFLAGGTFAAGTLGHRMILALQRDVAVPPQGQTVLAHLYGYGLAEDCANGGVRSTTPAGLVERYAARPAQAWFAQTRQAWAERLLRLDVPQATWVAREAAWHAYYSQALARFDPGTDQFHCDPGGSSTFAWGLPPSVRDCCRSALALLPSNPAQVRGTIRHLACLESRFPLTSRGEGRIEGNSGNHSRSGRCDNPFSVLARGDSPLWLLWLIADYALLYRDRAFMDQPIASQALPGKGALTPRQLVCRLLAHTVGLGDHQRRPSPASNLFFARLEGLLGRLGPVRARSTLTTALAALVLDRAAELCHWLGERDWAERAAHEASLLRLDLEDAWNGRWFAPHFPCQAPDPFHWECQPWAALVSSPARRFLALRSIQERLDGGVPISGMAPLIWAWALEDGQVAWDLLLAISLAAHAERNPAQWRGIWSGDGSWDFHPPLPHGVNHLHGEAGFPIASAERHGQFLFALARLCGLEADARGLRIVPRLPFTAFRFETMRFGLHWREDGASGYIVPQGNECVLLRLQLRQFLAAPPQVLVDGRPTAVDLSADGSQVSFPAFLRGGTRTEWKVRWERRGEA